MRAAWAALVVASLLWAASMSGGPATPDPARTRHSQPLASFPPADSSAIRPDVAEELADLLAGIRGLRVRAASAGPIEIARVGRGTDGLVRMVGVPPGHYLPVPLAPPSAPPETAAGLFLQQRVKLFTDAASSTTFSWIDSRRSTPVAATSARSNSSVDPRFRRLRHGPNYRRQRRRVRAGRCLHGAGPVRSRRSAHVSTTLPGRCTGRRPYDP